LARMDCRRSILSPKGNIPQRIGGHHHRSGHVENSPSGPSWLSEKEGQSRSLTLRTAQHTHTGPREICGGLLRLPGGAEPGEPPPRGAHPVPGLTFEATCGVSSASAAKCLKSYVTIQLSNTAFEAQVPNFKNGQPPCHKIFLVSLVDARRWACWLLCRPDGDPNHPKSTPPHCPKIIQPT